MTSPSLSIQDVNFVRFHDRVLEPSIHLARKPPENERNGVRAMASAVGLLAIQLVSFGIEWGYFSRALAEQWNEVFSIPVAEQDYEAVVTASTARFGARAQPTVTGTEFVIDIPQHFEKSSTGVVPGLDRRVDRVVRIYESILSDSQFIHLSGAMNFARDDEWNALQAEADRSMEDLRLYIADAIYTQVDLEDVLKPWWLISGGIHTDQLRIGAGQVLTGNFEIFASIVDAHQSVGSHSREPLTPRYLADRGVGDVTPAEVAASLALLDPVISYPSNSFGARHSGPGLPRGWSSVSAPQTVPGIEPAEFVAPLVLFPVSGSDVARQREPDLQRWSRILGLFLRLESFHEAGLSPPETNQRTESESAYPKSP